MTNEQLCLGLARSDTETGVIELLKKPGYWDNPKVWRDHGDNENNFATIGNQSSNPESALVEKMINSVDAVLLAECRRRKINPEGESAPKSIKEAIFNYF